MQERIENGFQFVLKGCRTVVPLAKEVQNRIEDGAQAGLYRLTGLFGRKPIPLYQVCPSRSQRRRGR